MVDNGIYPVFQSAFRHNHSTKNALLRVKSSFDVWLRSLETHENRSKEAGRLPIQMHETHTENKMATDQQIQETTGVNRTSDEIRRRRWNWIGHILRKNREEHCVTALEWRPEGRRRPGRPKTTWRRMVEDERRVAGWQSWTTVRALAANRSGWKENVKALCALWHEEI